VWWYGSLPSREQVHEALLVQYPLQFRYYMPPEINGGIKNNQFSRVFNENTNLHSNSFVCILTFNPPGDAFSNLNTDRHAIDNKFNNKIKTYKK
jgi:hypothetical protein